MGSRGQASSLETETVLDDAKKVTVKRLAANTAQELKVLRLHLPHIIVSFRPRYALQASSSGRVWMPTSRDVPHRLISRGPSGADGECRECGVQGLVGTGPATRGGQSCYPW